MEIEQIEERRYAPLFDCHREGDRSVDNMMVQIGYVLRIFFAGICGLMIGIERRNRLKEAGIRTHLIVALGSALMMIVSKYGFFDLQGHSFLRADASRIASQIVSGIGFLGAGMIIWHHRTVSGLTTAAGIWATAGIGMAIGAGLYGVGGACALLILVSTEQIPIFAAAIKSAKSAQTGAKGYAGFYADSTLQSTWQA